MNELRWILLAAGIALIAGLYLWGMRSRWQGRGEADASRRPAVFTGGVQGFETEAEEAAPDLEEPAVMRAEARFERRIEPSFGDEDVSGVEDPHLRRADFDDEDEFESPAIGRREPTFSARSEPATPSEEPALRTEPTLRPAPALRTEPTLRPAPAPESAGPETRPEPVAEAAAAKPRRAQKIMAIRVSAQAPSRFEGPELLAALRSEGLGFGRYEIFHRLHDDGRPIFSVASLREPGTFDLEEMPTTHYPGIAMFTVLPGPVPASEAFDEMVFTARAIATYLNGALADERGVPLTAVRVGTLREEALEFERTAGSA